MSIKEGKITGYSYEIYFEGAWIHTSDEEFDTEEEAREDAESYIEQKIEDYKADGAWHEDDSRENFDIEIIDIIEEEDEEDD